MARNFGAGLFRQPKCRSSPTYLVSERSYVRHVPPTPSPLHRHGRDILSTNLRAARHKAGLSQERLALTAGLDRSFYVDVENGHHSPAVDRLWDIAIALGTTPADLLRSCQ